MPELSLEDLNGYLDDALSAEETSRVETALRQSASLRQILRSIMQEQDRGEHSVGGIWRRRRLSCPTREQMGGYLLNALDDGLHDYIQFHLVTIGCSYCQANLADLQSRHKEPPAHREQRRRKLFESSAGLLRQP